MRLETRRRFTTPQNSSYNTTGAMAGNATDCVGVETANTILADPQLIKLIASVSSSTSSGVECYTYAGSYAFSTVLTDGVETFCVDSAGTAEEGTTATDNTGSADCQ